MHVMDSPEMEIAKKRYEQFKEACETAGISAEEFMKDYAEPSMPASDDAPEMEMGSEEIPESEEDVEPGSGNLAKRKMLILMLQKKKAQKEE